MLLMHAISKRGNFRAKVYGHTCGITIMIFFCVHLPCWTVSNLMARRTSFISVLLSSAWDLTHTGCLTGALLKEKNKCIIYTSIFKCMSCQKITFMATEWLTFWLTKKILIRGVGISYPILLQNMLQGKSAHLSMCFFVASFMPRKSFFIEGWCFLKTTLLLNVKMRSGNITLSVKKKKDSSWIH